jgi:hypothetical protein
MPCIRSITANITLRAIIKMLICLINLSIRSTNGGFAEADSVTSCEILPTCVSNAGANYHAHASSFQNCSACISHIRSFSNTKIFLQDAVCFFAAIDSPVRKLSSISKSRHFN